MHVDFLRAVKGGLFLRKKPLECVLSVYTNSENALGKKKGLQRKTVASPDLFSVLRFGKG